MGKLSHLGFVLRAKPSHWRILRQGRSDTTDLPFRLIVLAATWGMTRSWGGARMQPGAGEAGEEADTAIQAGGAKAPQCWEWSKTWVWKLRTEDRALGNANI